MARKEWVVRNFPFVELYSAQILFFQREIYGAVYFLERKQNCFIALWREWILGMNEWINMNLTKENE